MKTVRWLAIAFLTSFAAILVVSSASGQRLEHDSSSVIFDYEVTNDYGIHFADEYERLGGVHTLGYPASYRFRLDDGFVYQVTQGALLQWRPEVKSAYLANTFEMLEHAGFDQWLLDTKGIPLPIKDDGSDGDWGVAKEIRLAWLTNDQIKARFLANPNPEVIASWSENRAIELYGLPMSYPEKHGPFISQRFQRVALQLWVEEVAGMPAVGTVVRVLGGDLLKEACLIPSYALSPKERMSCASGSYVAQHSASQSASGQSLERESSTVIFDYEVTNDRGILFADEYERLGGAHTLGYPASYRFRLDDGFVYQVTQGALLQWRPEVQRAWLANTFEMLEHAGLDQWLLNTKGVPLPIVDDDSDGDWERAKEIRLAWLTNDKIKARFFANPNPSEITSWSEDRAIELYGLPMSYPEKHGPFITQRFQRVAFQLWVEEVAGMPEVGTVVRVLGGDLLKEACLIPSHALAPEDRISCASGTYVLLNSASQKSMVVQITWVYSLPALSLDIPNLPSLFSNPPPPQQQPRSSDPPPPPKQNSPRPNSDPPPNQDPPPKQDPPPDPPPTPDPAIEIVGLGAGMGVGASDTFAVSSSNLDPSKSYAIKVSTDNANIGFNSNCSDRQKDLALPAGTSHVASFTLYGCAATSGTVTAELLEGGATIATDTQPVAVVPDPSISISGLLRSLNVSGNDSFTVSAYNLDSSSSYTIRVRTNRDDIGLNSDCSNRRQNVSVQQGTSYSASFTLYGCMAPGGTVTATLLLGNTIVDTATQPVAVSLGETVTITGLGANLNVGATDPFTVTASNLDTSLDTSTSYTLQVTTDGGGGIGFNPDCTDHEEEVTVPAGRASYSITADSLSLYGCGTAGGTVTATLLSGNTTIAEVDRVVTVQLAGSPTISIDDLLPDLNEGASDAFTVSVDNLDSSKSYTIEVTADNSDIGFNGDCTDLDGTSPAITGKTSDTASFTLYGCDSDDGIVTATLKTGGNTVVSDTQRVKVNEPTITIKGLALSLNEAASHAFTVGVDNLDSSSSYTIRLTTDDDDLGFNSDCSNRLHDVPVTANSTSFTTSSLTLYGCDAPGGTVTAILLRGSAEVARDTQDVTVNEPTIQIVGLAGDVNEGATHTFTVIVNHLAASSSHTIRVSSSNGNIGFDAGCSLQQSDQTVLSAQTSHTATFTLYGCAAATETITAKLLRAGAEVKTATQDVTVNASTIEIEEIDAPLYEDASVKFTVRVEHLGSSQPYTIQVTTDNGGGIGFSSDCSDQQEDVTVQNSVSHTSSLTLHGCSTAGGAVTAKLLLGSTEIDTDTEDVTVVPNPTIEITGLVETIDQGENDEFTVAAQHLVSSQNYAIRVTAENGIGFNSDCSNQSEPVAVPAGGSHSASLRLYACTAIGGTVTVNLLLDSNSIATDTHDVTVVPSPVISISDLATSIDVGASDQFKVSAQHLVSSQTYSISVTTGSGRGIGFNSDCTDTEEPVSVDANSQTFTSNAGDLVLYGCGTAGGTVTAKLMIENTEVDTATQPVTVQLAGSSTIAIENLVTELNKDASDSFTVSVGNLDSSTSYTIEVTTDDAHIGFNSDCTDREESLTVTANSLSHTTESITLYGCDAGDGEVTATLESGGNSLVSAEQTVTVLPDPTISISDLNSPMNVGQSDAFTVAASNLDSSETYTVQVTTDNGGGIGFNGDCTDHEEPPVTVPANSEAYTSNAGDLVLYGCGTAGGTVTAKLLSGNTEIHTATQPVTVQLAGSPTIEISGLVSDLNEGASDSFTVSVGNLDASTSYTIEVTTDDADIGFTSDCTDGVESRTVTANSLSHTTESITLYGCDAGDGEVTATLESGGNSLVSAEQTVTVLPDPSIQISGLLGTVYVGENDAFTVTASNLDSLTSYTIRVTTNNGIGFDSNCSDQQDDPTVPANITSHTTGAITLHGCAATAGTVTATLLSGANTIDDATQTVTVKLRPSIAFSGLAGTINVGSNAEFTVIASNLDSSATYTIRLTTYNTNIGFSDDCTDQQDDPTVPASGTSRTTSAITLYGCATDGGTVTATLLSGSSSVATADQEVEVAPASTKQIGFSDWLGPFSVGWGHPDTHVRVQQLDSTKSYKIQMTLDDDEEGDRIGLSFDSGCSEQEKEVTVPADSTSHDVWFEISGCDRTEGTLTVKLLLADDNTLVATETRGLQVFEEANINLHRLNDPTQRIDVGNSHEFSITVHGLDSTRTYTIQIKTDKTGARLDSTCSVSEKTFTLTGKTYYSTSDGDFTVDGTTYDTLYGCSVKKGNLNVRLYRGDSVQLNSHRWKWHNIDVRNP